MARTSAQQSVMRAKRGGNQAAFNRANEARHKNVFDSGVWPLPSNLEDLELRRLAKALPATVLNCKVDSTTEKYLRTFQRQKTWAEASQGKEGGGAKFYRKGYSSGGVLATPESIQSKSAVEKAMHALG